MSNKVNSYKVSYRVGDKRKGYEEKEIAIEAPYISLAAERAQTIIWHTEPSNKHKDIYRIEEIEGIEVTHD